jgi:2-polyprenyl-3-methyl-5-hydroxy-6-metoxy-1,4-benzoquinol methylase
MAKNELEDVDKCPVCGSGRHSIVLSEVEDLVLNTKLFSGQLSRCLDCSHHYFSQRLAKEFSHLAYSGYYTRRSSRNLEESAGKKFVWLKELFVRRSGYVTEVGRRLLVGLPVVNYFLKRAIRYCPIERPREFRALDVGCGNGQFLARMTMLGVSIDGIDPDLHSVAACVRQGLNAVCAEPTQFQPGHKYDFISCSHVIEHVRDPLITITAIRGHLKCGGSLYLSTPNIAGIGFRRFGRYWRGLDFPRHLSLFSESEIERILKMSGFNEIVFINDPFQSFLILRSSAKLQSLSMFRFLLSAIPAFILTVLARENSDVIVAVAKV